MNSSAKPSPFTNLVALRRSVDELRRSRINLQNNLMARQAGWTRVRSSQLPTAKPIPTQQP